MDKRELLDRVEWEVRLMLTGEGTGHDFHHIERVRTNALKIAEGEGADLFLVELAALVHDIGDYKISDDDRPQREQIKEFLSSLSVDDALTIKVINIVDEVSFSKNGVHSKPSSLEAMCVQDADRLDALGAIGIARCFAYGGKVGNPIYEPGNDKTSIGHFHEKLLLLKGGMHTETGSEMAEERHGFLVEFLEHFENEWHAGA